MKLDTPEPDCFVADGDASLGEEIFDEWSATPAMTEIESIVGPGSITDDVRSLVGMHRPIVAVLAS